MRFKIAIIFIGSILLPTALLSHFGLKAVRSEKQIVENSINERYESIADIVENEIRRSVDSMPEDLAKDTKYLESVMLGEAAIFKDEVRIFDRNKRDISGPTRSFTADAEAREREKPALTRPLKGLPYTLAVYERHPLLLQKLEEKKRGLYFYITLIDFSALLILCGGLFTLWALSREWRSTELKSEFVSHLSHDLRRPLTSIRMFSEMLKENRLPSEEKREYYYKIISDESERLTNLANNILDFSRIEMGKKKYDFKNENISKVVEDSINNFRAHIGDDTRKINLKIEPGIPVFKFDPNAISQALSNLLTNALKFSPPDREIDVRVSKGMRDVIIEVIDRGVGISPADRKRIFEKFYRASKKEISETEGTGLGLTLVKYIAEAHKGRVRVDSEEGHGSKFSLILPT